MDQARPGPRTSVIIATKNSGPYIRECLASVMSQTVLPKEIILVDAASDDETLEIAAEYPLARVIQQVGKGFSGAWNEGIAASRGEFLAFIDSDDCYTPRKIERQEALLDADPNALGSIGFVRHFADPGEELPPSFNTDLLNSDKIAWMPGTLMARRALFERVGLWPENQVVAADADWFVTLRDKKIPMAVCEERLLNKRVHGANLSYSTTSNPAYAREFIQLLHASVKRKRAAASEGNDPEQKA
ncbi:MAG: glycosyltransferase [Pseudomonadota bacterium]